MEKITVKALKKRHAQCIELRSVTLSIYTLKVKLDDTWYWLVDSKGLVQRFMGAEQANNQLTTLSTDQAYLIHDSPYGEMVGQPDGQPPEPIRVPYNWRTDS